jgi:hypothetical protein
MFDYLQKYNNLPKELRDKISEPAVIAAIEELERKYGINLAAVVIRIMVKDIKMDDLARYLASEFNMTGDSAERLVNELKERVFIGVSDYLGIREKEIVSSSPVRAADDKRFASLTKGAVSPPLLKERSVPQPSSQEKVSENSSTHFYFSPEEEKEIQEVAQKIGGYIKDSSSGDKTEEKLDKIINKIHINFGSESLADRFKQILRIYLRGIRDRLDTKHTLMKPVAFGGLGFNEESAENVLQVVDGNLKSLSKDVVMERPKKIHVEEDKLKELPQYSQVGSLETYTSNNKRLIGAKKPDNLKIIGARDVEYDLASELAKKKDAAERQAEKKEDKIVPDIKAGVGAERAKKLDTAHELAPPPPKTLGADSSVQQANFRQVTLQDNKAIRPSGIELRNKKSVRTDKEQQPAHNTLTSRVSRLAGGKIKMEDVKVPPKVMGPVDELRYMNLIDFRRLDKDPFVAAEKIKEKINLLDDEYSKKVEGIKAWRLSPLNMLYLKMGEESISQKKPIDAIIEERKAAGKDYLNNKEFTAIINLNKSLRF